MIHKVIIIGGGCAGLTAAIYCARAQLNPILFVGDYGEKGGLLMKTSKVENYPGFPYGVDGYQLMTDMENQAINFGTQIINDEISSVDFTNRPFKLVDRKGTGYLAESIIICTGSKPNKLGIKNEDKFWTNGISSCAVCDGALYRDKKIVVVGGGDSAMEEALFLTKFSNVTLVHRGVEFRASKIMQERVLNNPKIEICYNTIIEKLYKNSNDPTYLGGISLKNTVGNSIRKMKVDGLFYGLGLKPSSDIFKDKLEMDDDGYIKVIPSKYETMTSISGVFVAGDVHDKKYRQAVIACGDGCKAALDVEAYLNHNQ